MGIAIGRRVTPFANQDRSWLVYEPAEYNLPVTLDPTLFPSGTFSNGRVPCGTVLAIKTATGLAGPYTSGNTDGLQTPVGYLLNDVEFGDPRGNSFVPVADAAVTRGIVIPARLPSVSGDSAAVHTALTGIQYRTI